VYFAQRRWRHERSLGVGGQEQEAAILLYSFQDEKSIYLAMVSSCVNFFEVRLIINYCGICPLWIFLNFAKTPACLLTGLLVGKS
jgi:hypothetical protein